MPRRPVKAEFFPWRQVVSWSCPVVSIQRICECIDCEVVIKVFVSFEVRGDYLYSHCDCCLIGGGREEVVVTGDRRHATRTCTSITHNRGLMYHTYHETSHRARTRTCNTRIRRVNHVQIRAPRNPAVTRPVPVHAHPVCDPINKSLHVTRTTSARARCFPKSRA